MNHQEDDNDDDKHNGPNKSSERYAKIKLVTVIAIIFGYADSITGNRIYRIISMVLYN